MLLCFSPVGIYHQYDMMAFPENQSTSGLAIIKNTTKLINGVAAGFSAIGSIFTGKKQTPAEKDDQNQVQLQMPSNVEIREGSMKVYLAKYAEVLSSSCYDQTLSIYACVQEVCHILKSIAKFPVTTSSKPIKEINTYDKSSLQIKKV